MSADVVVLRRGSSREASQGLRLCAMLFCLNTELFFLASFTGAGWRSRCGLLPSLDAMKVLELHS